jgi:hypothetical protein
MAALARELGEARRRGVVSLELLQGHSEGIAFEAKTLGSWLFES